MFIEIVGNFFNNHSLSIVNRNLALSLDKLKVDVRLIALDQDSLVDFKVSESEKKRLLELCDNKPNDIPDIQIRHTYPPVWRWPDSPKTKVVYIQPWEYPKVPFEWQYKFETFADALVVPSNYCAEVFKTGGLYPEDVFVVPNGYNPEIFNAERSNVKEPDKFTFLFVGNPQWRKGLDILLNVWPKVFLKADKVRLIIKDNVSIYGKSNILNEVIKLQYKTDCAEIKYISDELSDLEMAELYKTSKILVHPYRAEGFGMHVQEAAACGCYPLVSDKGPTEDFIPNTIRKIHTTQKIINISDERLFILKPGDSMSLMSSHTIINDPSPDSLARTMSYLYRSHNRDALLKEVDNITTLTTWDMAAEKLKIALSTIMARPNTKRRSL